MATTGEPTDQRSPNPMIGGGQQMPYDRQLRGTAGNTTASAPDHGTERLGQTAMTDNWYAVTADDPAQDFELLHNAIAQSPIGFAVIGPDMRYVAVNEVLAELHGRQLGDHPGRTFDEVIPRVADAAREVFAQVLRERVAVRSAVLGGFRPERAEEGLIWEDVWYPLVDGDGRVTGVAVAVIEVSHLRRSQDRLSALQRIDEALARSETVPDVVAALDSISDKTDGMSIQLWLAGEDRSTRIAEFPAGGLITALDDTGSVAYVEVAGTGGPVFGVLRWSWSRDRRFSAEDRRYFATISDRFAASYERARQRERAQGAGRRAEAVLEALAPLANAASTADVVRVVTSFGPRALGANGVSIALIDPSDAGRRKIVGSVGYPEEFMERIRITSIDLPTPPNRVMVSSQPLYLHSPEEMTREFPEVAGALVGTAQSWAVLPLRSEGRTIGAMSLSFADPERFGGSRRVELAGYASHIADALARALRQEEDHQVAVSVQRSLLPAGLPRIDGAALTARYLPGSELEIGGDWYDAVRLEDGRLFLVVGDVMGHGVEAALAMGQLRAAARALSQGYRPAQLLSQMDRFVDDVENGSLATAAAVVLDLRHGVVEYSLAGHPPPLLRSPDGAVVRLDGALSVPLGYSREPRRSATAALPPGSMVVLYTDGLIERRGEDLGIGLRRLEVAVGALDHHDPEAAADALIGQCLEGFRQRDDIALVCVAVAAA
jgi:PAS domain-containing protein